MARKISHAINKFRKLKVEIEEAVLRDARFRAICEDYGEAVDALDFWSQSTDERAAKRITEYRLLLLELEREIFVELQRCRGEPSA